MPKTEFRRERRIWWSIVSKAAERSNKRRTEMLSLSRVESRFVVCHTYDYGKHGPVGAQRPPTHHIWPRLRMDSQSSELTWLCPCICVNPFTAPWTSDDSTGKVFSLTLYKVPQTVSLICSAFSGDWSWEETESVIQFVGSERVQFLTQETGAASPIISLVLFFSASWQNSAIDALVEILSYTPKLVYWEVSLTRPMLLLAASFSYTPHARFSGQSLLHAPC